MKSTNNKKLNMNQDIAQALIFLNKASQNLENGKSKEFKCPLCGGKATAKRSRHNGHLWAECHNCGEKISE